MRHWEEVPSAGPQEREGSGPGAPWFSPALCRSGLGGEARAWGSRSGSPGLCCAAERAVQGARGGGPQMRPRAAWAQAAGALGAFLGSVCSVSSGFPWAPCGWVLCQGVCRRRRGPAPAATSIRTCAWCSARLFSASFQEARKCFRRPDDRPRMTQTWRQTELGSKSACPHLRSPERAFCRPLPGPRGPGPEHAWRPPP